LLERGGSRGVRSGGYSGAERRGPAPEERREEREGAVAHLDRERGVNACSGGPTP
jgi:hypothetical protein